MRVLITGAGGFLGQAVVKAARRAGHQVLAMHRPASLPTPPEDDGDLEILSGDLRQRGAWCGALAKVEGVIHCAAAASGDLARQLAGTVLATENLLAALPADLKRFVHISSFSVYDFDAPGWRGTLDEATPLESQPLRRDAYTQSKLFQEQLVRSFAASSGTSLLVARPGAIFGPGKDWDFGRALHAARFNLIFAPGSPMRLIHVDNCADAIVAALAAPIAGEAIVNLVDDECPSHWAFHRAGQRAGLVQGTAIPVPYVVVLALGLAARIASKVCFAGRARLPEMLDSPRQRVRWRPLRYANAHARHLLNWQSRVTMAQAIAEMAEGQAAITEPTITAQS